MDMEQILNDNVYVIDLGEINSASEIIFELSSVLDKEEAKNKRICLKLGNIDLNQAQLLSIKSLICGIDSILSSIDTKSVETEKVALSLGIIISNISAENTHEVSPAMPYKTADEFKEEIYSNSENKDDVIIEESDLPVQNDIQNSIINEELQNSEKIIEEPEKQEEEIIQDKKEDIITAEDNNSQNSIKEDVQDELDVIFGSNPVQKTIFDMEQPVEEVYADREELTDIIVPEQEYTKEDIELESFPTKYIKQTIRSGQVINYEGNIVIIGDCHPGCEVIALGDITVWGVLSGIAHAGAAGNQKARVRALKMNAIQLRIANCYSRRPDSLNTVFIEKTNSFTPEEARIINGEIVVFKIND